MYIVSRLEILTAMPSLMNFDMSTKKPRRSRFSHRLLQTKHQRLKATQALEIFYYFKLILTNRMKSLVIENKSQLVGAKFC